MDSITTDSLKCNQLTVDFGAYLHKHRNDDNLKGILPFARQHYVELIDGSIDSSILDELLRAFYNFLTSRKQGLPHFDTYQTLGNINKVIEYALLSIDN